MGHNCYNTLKGREMRRSRSYRGQLSLFAVFVFFWVISSLIISAPPRLIQSDQEQALLKQTLKETGDYADKVINAALYYVCTEKISDKEYFFGRTRAASSMFRQNKFFHIKKIKKQTFTYDYQLVKKKGELTEKRILLEENGKKRYQKNADLNRLKYTGKYLVFGPVGFLSKYWQPYFDFKIIGEDKLDNRNTVIFKATPKQKMEENNNIARIWVDKINFQILKIELDPASIKDYENEKITTRLGTFYKTVSWTIFYGIEKNGVRFPSRQIIQEVFIHPKRGYRAVKRETNILYQDYKFFTVETDIKYK